MASLAALAQQLIASLAALAQCGSRVAAAAFLTPSQPAAGAEADLLGKLAARSFVQAAARDPGPLG
jgi:hypothetical protein